MKAETKNQIDALATDLGPQIEIKDSVATIAADAYVKSLPEALTLEIVKALQEHNAVFLPAVTKAFSEKSIDAMKADTKIEQISLCVPMVGDDKFDVTFKKSYEHMDPSTKEMKTSYGGISASLTVQAARHNRGAMSVIKNEMKAAAMAAFCKE
jgi:hypothetical protein